MYLGKYAYLVYYMYNSFYFEKNSQFGINMSLKNSSVLYVIITGNELSHILSYFVADLNMPHWCEMDKKFKSHVSLIM